MEQQPNLQNNDSKDTFMTIVETILLSTLLVAFINVFLGITGAMIPIVIIAISFGIIKSIKQKFKERRAGKSVIWIETKSLIGLIFLIIAFFAYYFAKRYGLI